MRRPDDRPARRRAVIAVTALYALLLQAFLLTLTPAPPRTDAPGVICAEHGGAPVDDGVPCQQHPCCILTQVTQPLATVASVPAGLVAPPRRSIVLAWRPAAALGPRAPPDPAVSSRGPPTV